MFNLKSNLLAFQTLHFVSEIQSRLSSQGTPHFTVNLQKGDMLYIPQMWWQLLTLPSDPILFVQFLWPSKMQTSSVVQSSFKTRGKSEHVCKFLAHGVIGKIQIKMSPSAVVEKSEYGQTSPPNSQIGWPSSHFIECCEGELEQIFLRVEDTTFFF